MDYFITIDYLKSNTPITQNVDGKDIIPFVGPAADMFLKPLIGSYFYAYMLAGYNAQTLNVDEFALYKEFQPIVAWRAAADAVYALTYSLRNKGLVTQDGENSTVADSEMVIMMKRHYDQKAEWFEERLRKYLILNKDLFPEFTSNLNNDSSITDIIPKSDSGYNNDMLMI